MSDNYLLYDPAAFGALEIKEDTRDAEILRLRSEVEKLQKYYAELNETNAKLLVLERERAEKLRAENEKLTRRSKMWFKVAQDLGHQDTFLPDVGDSDD